jgi:hypothetical protein
VDVVPLEAKRPNRRRKDRDMNLLDGAILPMPGGPPVGPSAAAKKKVSAEKKRQQQAFGSGGDEI